jgi:hypothetical protein
MAFDDHRNCVMLFGGITNAVVKGSEFRLADTWKRDGNLCVGSATKYGSSESQ